MGHPSGSPCGGRVKPMAKRVACWPVLENTGLLGYCATAGTPDPLEGRVCCTPGPCPALLGVSPPPPPTASIKCECKAPGMCQKNVRKQWGIARHLWAPPAPEGGSRGGWLKGKGDTARGWSWPPWAATAGESSRGGGGGGFHGLSPRH